MALLQAVCEGMLTPPLRTDDPAANRKKLAQTEPKLVQSLVALMDSPSLKVQCQAALALRNLASDGALADFIWNGMINTGLIEILI